LGIEQKRLELQFERNGKESEKRLELQFERNGKESEKREWLRQKGRSMSMIFDKELTLV